MPSSDLSRSTPVPHDQLAQLVDAVLASRKYKSISQDFIKNLGSQELAKYHTLKAAVKATKNKLHQVGGAYWDSESYYASWLMELRHASEQEQLRQACMRIMAHHASTRERLPLLEEFYTTLLADLPPINSVIDIACGLHPLAIPWMPLARHVQYYAYDMYRDMTDFLNDFLAIIHLQGHAQACDVIQSCPTHKVDVAFMLKAIPCLEQVDRSAGLRLLGTINADYVIVSFPVRSLGGRKKAMTANYEAHFRELVAHKRWPIERFEFASELVFRIVRNSLSQ
jgi:16S rRNA (guanine(1405)-N(7))-methyltransferase